MGFKKLLGIDAPSGPGGPRTRTMRGLITCVVAVAVWFVATIVGTTSLSDVAIFMAFSLWIVCVVAFIHGFISTVSGALAWAKQSDQTTVTVASPAGWHTDPGDSTQLRYWDGRQWTDQYAQRHNPDADQEQREPGDGA